MPHYILNAYSSSSSQPTADRSTTQHIRINTEKPIFIW
jgi:hypothetical protein